MVVQRVRNNTSKTNTICGLPSYNRKETKLKDVCSSKQQRNTCVRTAECKSDQRYPCSEKEVILYFHFKVSSIGIEKKI